MILQLLNILAPILVCSVIGIAWKRLGYDYPSDFIGRLVMNVGAPCLILNSLTTNEIQLAALADVVIVAVLVLIATLVVFIPILKAFGFNHRTYLPPLMFSNSGNMALPLCLFAFGEQGLALAIGYFITMMLAHVTLGLLILEGAERGLGDALVNLGKQPMLYSMLLGLVIVLNDWSLPLWAAHSIDLLAGVTIPLMLITLGVSLTSLKVGFWQRALGLSLIKAVLGVGVALVACQLLDIQGITRDVIIVQAAMPAAVFNYLFAVRYRQQPEEVAGIVVASTLLVAAILPALFAWILQT